MNIKTILTSRLSSDLTDFGLDAEKAEEIFNYISFLLKVNKKISLTSMKNFDFWYTSHIEDSLKAYTHFIDMRPNFFIDCGSGNGLPGIIFAILSKLPFTLCDVDHRKAEFLKSACYRLKLKGKVYCGPIEDLAALKESTRKVYVYRGLGPDKFLTNQYSLDSNAGHFRFMSRAQNSLFQDSDCVNYKLSDKSSRFLEISPIK